MMSNQIETEIRNSLIEVYKTMWERTSNIDKMDLSYAVIPPTIVGLIVSWVTIIPNVNSTSVLIEQFPKRIVIGLAISGQALICSIILILLRNYIDHARAISNIAAVEEALQISKYIPIRLNQSDSSNRKRLFTRLFRSSKGILFVLYHLLLWLIAISIMDWRIWIATGVLQAIILCYLYYYFVSFKRKAGSIKE